MTPREWSTAYVDGAWSPEQLEDFPMLHLTMLRDALERLATQKFGEGCWVMDEGSCLVEIIEPLSRDHEEVDEDEDSETFGETIRWYDGDTHFRMSARFRAKEKVE